MEFRRTFPVPEWNTDVQGKVIEYWSGRGVSLRPAEDGRLVGRRGSIYGNLASTNIAHVITTVTVRHNGRQVECVILLDTRFQLVLSWDRKTLDLELERFESYLTGSAHLLRPVEPPDTASLLHPAASSQANTAEKMLRPAGLSDSEEGPAHIQGVSES